MLLRDIRKENIDRLRFQYETQTKLAAALGDIPFNQRSISYVVCGKRHVNDHDARQTESRLVIPPYWIDRQKMIEDGWSEIKNYRTLPLATRAIVDDFLNFMHVQTSFDNKERSRRITERARKRIAESRA